MESLAELEAGVPDLQLPFCILTWQNMGVLSIFTQESGKDGSAKNAMPSFCFSFIMERIEGSAKGAEGRKA